jgi:hypothetical protein
MSFMGDVVAGCAPGTNECAGQADLPGLDTWFILLVIVPLILAIVAGAVLLGRRRQRRRAGARSRAAVPEGSTTAAL